MGLQATSCLASWREKYSNMTTIQSINQLRNRKRKAVALVIALLDEDERQVQRSCWVPKFFKQRDNLGAKER